MLANGGRLPFPDLEPVSSDVDLNSPKKKQHKYVQGSDLNLKKVRLVDRADIITLSGEMIQEKSLVQQAEEK